jgi:hypothetical protein
MTDSEELNELGKRVEALEEQIKKLNKNMDALLVVHHNNLGILYYHNLGNEYAPVTPAQPFKELEEGKVKKGGVNERPTTQDHKLLKDRVERKRGNNMAILNFMMGVNLVSFLIAMAISHLYPNSALFNASMVIMIILLLAWCCAELRYNLESVCKPKPPVRKRKTKKVRK